MKEERKKEIEWSGNGIGPWQRKEEAAVEQEI